MAASSARSVMRVDWWVERTETKVAAASTSVPPAVASAEIVAQSAIVGYYEAPDASVPTARRERRRELVVASEPVRGTTARSPRLDVRLDVVEEQRFRPVVASEPLRRDFTQVGLVLGTFLGRDDDRVEHPGEAGTSARSARGTGRDSR